MNDFVSCQAFSSQQLFRRIPISGGHITHGNTPFLTGTVFAKMLQGNKNFTEKIMKSSTTSLK